MHTHTNLKYRINELLVPVSGIIFYIGAILSFRTQILSLKAPCSTVFLIDNFCKQPFITYIIAFWGEVLCVLTTEFSSFCVAIPAQLPLPQSFKRISLKEYYFLFLGVK